jgi:hypothetical protein
LEGLGVEKVVFGKEGGVTVIRGIKADKSDGEGWFLGFSGANIVFRFLSVCQEPM